MGNAQLLVLFLRAFVAAKKSLALYPPGSEMATTWIQRFHRSLDNFFQQGLSFPIRVGRDRFLWASEELLTLDPVLEGLRYDLESRGIVDFSIEPAVEDGELAVFLELLNLSPASLSSIAGAAAHLREKNVVHISVSAPSTGAEPGEGVAAASMQTAKDELDLFVDAVLETVEERFSDLTYDRPGLSGWFKAVADDERVEVLYSAIKMLGAMAEGGSDREIRTRTMLEALLALPESTLRSLLTGWLLPLAGSDLVAFSLLTQVTEDELGDIARLVPQEQLLSLTSELLEFPWEEGKRQRFVEAISSTLRRHAEPEVPVAPAAVLARDDPLLLELRREITAACHPDVLLERSTDILLALIFNVESDEYPSFAVDALEEIVGEALARGKLDLAVMTLSNLAASTQFGGQSMREHARRLALFRRRVGGRTQTALVAGLLRRDVGVEQMALAADFLRLVAREGVEEFTTLLADERDRRVRARMCQVLVKVGPSIIPTVLPRFDDARWYVVRNIVYILGKVGDGLVFNAVAAVLDHPHPRVRVEAVRALTLIGSAQASGPISRCVTDADETVRRAAVKSLGSLRNDDAVPTLRDLVTLPPNGPGDLEIRQEAIRALATIGSPIARAALLKLASRRVWFWKRAERRIRAMAEEALHAKRAPPVGVTGADDDG